MNLLSSFSSVSLSLLMRDAVRHMRDEPFVISVIFVTVIVDEGGVETCAMNLFSSLSLSLKVSELP